MDTKREPVSSSAVKSIGYDPKTKILSVEVKGGSVYHYPNVSAEHHAAFMSSCSKGGYFATIKAKYKGSR